MVELYSKLDWPARRALLGVSVIGESMEVSAEKLTEHFGKYQNSTNGTTEVSIDEISGVDAIETKELDGTPEPAKTLDFDELDIANKSLPYKIAKVEAMMSTQTTTTQTIKNVEDKKKKASTDDVGCPEGRAHADDDRTTRKVQARDARDGKEVARDLPMQNEEMKE